MNAIPKTSEMVGPVFFELSIGKDFVVQGTQVYFDLIKEVHGKTIAYISAVIEANESTGWTVWNNTSDPQNDMDVQFDLLEVTTQNIAQVEDFDEVMAIQGQPFFLTEKQSEELNTLLKEFFDEEKIKQIKQMAA